MAMLQRLFSNKRSVRGNNDDKGGRRQDLNQKSVPPKLDKSKIRLVIYEDTDRGRTPYYDSNAISKVEDADKNAKCSAPKNVRAKVLSCSNQKDASISQQRPSSKYHFQRLGSDVKVLEEMMFGSVGMAFKGSTLKVHQLRSPSQLMVTKVFIPEKPQRENMCEAESDLNSLPGSSADFSSEEFIQLPSRKSKEKYARSIPVDVPTKDLLSDCSTDDDSGLASFTSSGSLRASFPSPSNSSASSYNSLHRRWMRAQTTTLDGQRLKQGLERSIMSHTSETSMTRASRNKLAIGILFGSYDEKDQDSNNLFQSFFFSHFALVEGHVERLRSVVEKAYFNRRNFLPATMEALEVFRNDIYDLYMAPRLPEPVWLTMMSTTTYRTRLCEKFMQEFTSLVSKYDNKNCKFFVSTLLSAVLTQHLAWVATVTPAGGTPSRTYLDKHSAKWVDTLAKTHPYNPLWAQLGDLFGAIGLPLKISRTVVVGRKADVVKKFLNVLSYFIRCSDVLEASDLEYLGQLVNETNFDLSLSPSSDGSHGDASASPSSGVLHRRTSSSGAGQGVVKTLSPNNGTRHEDKGLNRQQCECGNGSHSEPSLSDCAKAFCDKCSDCEVGRTSDHAAVNIRRPESADVFRTSISDSPATSVAQTENVQTAKSSVISPHHSKTCEVLSNEGKTCHEAMSELHFYAPNSLPLCSLTSSKVMEPLRESLRNVSKAGNVNTNGPTDFSLSSGEPILRSQSFSDGKVKSRLSQQLECEVADSKSRMGTSDIKKIFLAEGSNSMFEEYFEPGIVTKTVDDLNESEKALMTSSNTSLSSKGEGRKEGERVSISRQSSIDQKGYVHRPTSLVGKNSRSITPTELSRRRHLSSTGSIDYEAFDPMIHCKEIKMPEPMTECAQFSVKAFDRNFGRSLLAGYTDHYMSDFVLHGTSDTDFRPRLLNDLQVTVQHSILDEPVDEAVCVIADTDNWTVEVASSKVMGMSPSGCTTWTTSQLVADLIESVLEVWKLKMSAEFCLMHLEDRLQEIYFKSLMLSEYLRGAHAYSQRELSSMLGFESSDMPLLLAIAGTHTPSLALGAQ